MNVYNKPITITIHTKNNKTEDKEKISKALKNVINIQYNIENDRIRGKSDDYKDYSSSKKIIKK